MAASASATASDLWREPVLPPGFSALALGEGGDAFAHARTHADALGAASLVWVRRFDLVEFAVVLEPAEPLRTARLAHYMAMTALADCLAVHVPAERPLVFAWPDALLLDGGLVGGGRLAWPDACGEDETPSWLVFGAMIRASASLGFETGLRRVGHGAGVALDEIGMDDVEPLDLIESFARHLMLGVDEWSSKGPKAVCKRWLDRLPQAAGVRHGVDPSGDLLLKAGATQQRRSLVEALAAVSWYDAARREPKL
jgi:hypothetical protein